MLDDNKILTLPNGERILLPSTVHILFEVEHLRYATMATVSRCGMVWFNGNTVSSEMMLQGFIKSMSDLKVLNGKDDRDLAIQEDLLPQSETCAVVVSIVKEILVDQKVFVQAVEKARKDEHIMRYTDSRACGTLFTLISNILHQCLDYPESMQDFYWSKTHLSLFVCRKLLLSIVWSFYGDSQAINRETFAVFLGQLMLIELPPGKNNVLDFDVTLPYGDWVSWLQRVPTVQIDATSVARNDIIIPTVDTVRQEDIVYTCLRENRPLIMCGPPGSGKTMILLNVLRRMPQTEVVGLNFSSLTTPQLFLRSLEQHCQYYNTGNGIIMAPSNQALRLVFFCDEINLPRPDQYGTQGIISFLRQILEQKGFWRTKDKLWIRLERIHFVGACNPATDVGRWTLTSRFTKYNHILFVDYPSEISLRQIYGTFISGILKTVPALTGYKESLTEGMIDVYLRSQQKFENKDQSHYIYSPRELTRWCRGLLDAIRSLDFLSLDGLVRVWAHEALRLFSDRLSEQSERDWTFSMICDVAKHHFPIVDEKAALQGPFLFSNWISRNYMPVDRSQLKDFLKERLKTFGEEEVEVNLALYDDLLDHVLRIDRVFRQPQGHLILIGASGSGKVICSKVWHCLLKTTLSRFVAWMNGMKVFQLKVHRKYSQEDFDFDLKEVLRCAGFKSQKVCFIMDESNIMHSGFLERMNTLLANAEVPGLFENDELNTLIANCKDAAQKQGLFIDSQDEIFAWFTQQIINNLHFVFTMNPPESGLSSKATASPALFNRCVLNWFGDWSESTLFQVADNMLQDLDLYLVDSSMVDSRIVILQCLVSIHAVASVVGEQVNKDYGKRSHNTPGAFIEFLAQFRHLVEERRFALVEQRQHLSVGLDRIKATVLEINDLRLKLAQKQAALDEKNVLANQKLQSMIQDQQEAEQNRLTSMRFQKSLRLQESEITSRRRIVLADLSKAEPAVLEAQQSVQNIKKQHLTEVRSMTNPPEAVKLAMESVCTLLGHRVDNWRVVQGIIRRDDFIPSILKFDNELQMTLHVRHRMEREYMSMPNYNFESVNRASRACGPLVLWVEEQVNYSAILEKIGPLRAEVQTLEEEASSTKRQMQDVIESINQLEGSIENYKYQYAELINEVQEIRVAMNGVRSKIERSENLLDSLHSETQRWTSNEESFTEQTIVVNGDAMLSAAYLVYCGIFDQKYRSILADKWQHILLENGVRSSSNTSLIGFLSDGDDRLRWLSNGLSDDDLSVENVIMLENSKRYPLIIDPTGSAVSFLVRNFSNRRILVTSFLDPNFTKHIESALRFGTPIVIQDAEYFDPLLNNVLNKEYHRAGGRTLVSVGSQDVDFSQSFNLFLSTRDSELKLTPDICSRTSVVNFTITRSSLQSQSLARVLQFERPDVYERRNDLVKSRGEFASRLLQLEKGLLNILNETSTSVLEDDRIIESLEKLKTESASITEKVRNSSAVLEELEMVAAEYSNISAACSQIFTLLQSLHTLHHFYQFSLEYIQSIFKAALEFTSVTSEPQDSEMRRQTILRRLFIITFQRTTQGLLHEHRMMFGLMLVKLMLPPDEVQLLLVLLNENLLRVDGAESITDIGLFRETLVTIPEMKPLIENLTENSWRMFWSEGRDWLQDDIVALKVSDGRRALFHLLLIRMLKPEQFVDVAQHFILQTLDCQPSEQAMEDVLLEVSEMETTCFTPLLLTSVPGTDASYKFDALVKSKCLSCSSVAMGALESEALADRNLASAARNGSWVIFKNVHLSPEWLGSLEKKLRGLNAHEDFRLFLTLDSDCNPPNSIIHAGRVIVFESQPGIKASMQNLGVISMPDSLPKERARLLILLAWLHCVISERLQYKSIGWSKHYEINDADFECALHVVDNWVKLVGKSRSNVSPANLPWKAIRTILAIAIYGGKIDEQEDVGVLERLISQTLSPVLFEADSILVTTEPNLSLPDGSSMELFREWITSLPEHEPPTWLGLPRDAEGLLRKSQGDETISAWKRCRRWEL